MNVWRSLLIGGSETEVRVRARATRDTEKRRDTKRRREKKTNKKINGSVTVTVHICMVTVAIVHKCTILHPLKWVFFRPKCVKRLNFSILQNYPPAYVIALTLAEVFISKFLCPLGIKVSYAISLQLAMHHLYFSLLQSFVSINQRKQSLIL